MVFMDAHGRPPAYEWPADGRDGTCGSGVFGGLTGHVLATAFVDVRASAGGGSLPVPRLKSRGSGPLTPGPGGDAGRCTGHSASWWRPRGRPHRPTRPRATKYARSSGIPVTPLWPWFAPSVSAARLPCRARAVVPNHAQLAWTWLSRRRPVCSAIAASTVAKVGTLSLHPAAHSARSTHTGPSTMQIVIPRLEAR